jgi:hypothetical protein
MQKRRVLRDPWPLLRARFPRPAALASLLAYAEAVVPAGMSLIRVDFFQQPDGSFVLGEASVYNGAGRPLHSPGAELGLGQRMFDELAARGFIADSGH